MHVVPGAHDAPARRAQRERGLLDKKRQKRQQAGLQAAVTWTTTLSYGAVSCTMQRRRVVAAFPEKNLRARPGPI